MHTGLASIRVEAGESLSISVTGTGRIQLAWSLPDRPAHAVGTGTKVPRQHGERP